MEQRQVRLGDVVDDYCPRERRVTNHAVVALVGSEVKLTRCTTCDTEHPYKAARVPRRRQTKLVAALSSAGSDGPEDGAPVSQGPTLAAPVSPLPVDSEPEPPIVDPPVGVTRVDSVRRPLIRATLARPEGTPPPTRQAPVFTIRETTGQDGGVDRSGKASRKRRPGSEPNGNRIEGYGQSPRSGKSKNGSRPPRTRGASARGERVNKKSSRSRGKSRSR